MGCIKTFILCLICPTLLMAQDLNKPDDFRGFRKYLFGKSMQVFSHHYIVLTHETDSTAIYEVTLPEEERDFIDARIERVIVTELDHQVYRIEVHLDQDISHELLASIDHAYLVYGTERVNPCNMFNAKASLESRLTDSGVTPTDIPLASIQYAPALHFTGAQTRIIYGEVCRHEISWSTASHWSETGDPAERESRLVVRVTDQANINIADHMFYLVLEDIK